MLVNLSVLVLNQITEIDRIFKKLLNWTPSFLYFPKYRVYDLHSEILVYNKDVVLSIYHG